MAWPAVGFLGVLGILGLVFRFTNVAAFLGNFSAEVVVVPK